MSLDPFSQSHGGLDEAVRSLRRRRLNRISRTSSTDFLLSYAGLLPYRCTTCKRRSLVADWGWMVFLCAILVFLSAAGATAVRLRSGT